MMTKQSFCAYLASLFNVIVGLSLNEVAILVGIFTALATFCINWYYKHKESRAFRNALRGVDVDS